MCAGGWVGGYVCGRVGVRAGGRVCVNTKCMSVCSSCGSDYPNVFINQNAAQGHASFVIAIDKWYDEVSTYTWGGGYVTGAGHFYQVGASTLNDANQAYSQPHFFFFFFFFCRLLLLLPPPAPSSSSPLFSLFTLVILD